ncbi:MAG: aminotransferase class I/II-fold pyridoxal phosphate-dependent enzyme, partial [Chitinophagaceae bacterium]
LNLGIGSPDLPAHPEVIRALQESAAQPTAHKYQSYKGIPALRAAIAAWYLKWFNTTLQPETEILPLMGSKEGIMHICMTYLDAGDQALVPNPGYPTYAAAVNLAGAQAIPYILSETNAWLPDLAALEKNDLRKVKLMFVNFPHMPTGTMPDDAFFNALISFAQKHDILLVHDNPYGFILNEHPISMLSFEGARSCVIELNSLSKSHNMAGWRVGMLCGAATAIDEVLRFKSNMDSGMFLPVQMAAIKALQLERDWYDSINAVYAERKLAAASLLTLLQCSFSKEQKGMFLWAKVPAQYAHAEILSDLLLQKNAVFITPGSVFGDGGTHYLRISLCSPTSVFEEASQRIQTTL